MLSTASHTVDLLSFLMDSPAERVYAEGRLFEPEGKGAGNYYDGLVGTILWRNGGISTVISSDQGQSEYVSKWFHQVWDGRRSAVIHAHTSRVEFTNCEIDHLDAAELPPEARREPLILTNLLAALDRNAPHRLHRPRWRPRRRHLQRAGRSGAHRPPAGGAVLAGLAFQYGLRWWDGGGGA